MKFLTRSIVVGPGRHDGLGVSPSLRQTAERAGIDHETDAAALTVKVETAAILENGRRDGEYPAIGAVGCHGVFQLPALVVDVDADGT